MHPGVDACAPWAVSATAATVTGIAIAASITLILYIFSHVLSPESRVPFSTEGQNDHS